MKITNTFLDELTEKAKDNPRLRVGFDLRNTPEDQSQRMVNAIEPDSIVPIHRHQKTSETMVCIRGKFVVEIYDELERVCVDSTEFSADGPVRALNIPAGQWHTVHSLESGSVIIEMKDGPYVPMAPEDIIAR